MNRPDGSVSGKNRAMQMYRSIVMLHLMLGNGSGVDLERQVKRHHLLALVPLDAPLAAETAARCVHSLTLTIHPEGSSGNSALFEHLTSLTAMIKIVTENVCMSPWERK